MSEAAASAPVAAPSSEPTTQAAAPANDNTQGGAPPIANDNASPPADDVWHAENLAEEIASKKWRLKNGDREQVVDTKELLRLGQIGHAGYDAFRRAAEEKKALQAEQQRFEQQRQAFDQALRTNPLAVIRKLGLEDAILAAYEEEVTYQQLPPDQRQRYDLDRQRRALEEQQLAWQRQQEAARRQQQEHVIMQQAQQAEATFRQQYASALDAVGMPADPAIRDEAMRRMAAEHERLLDANPPIEVLARNTLDQMRRLGTAFRPPPEKLREEYGEDYVRQVQQADVQRVQTTRKAPPQGPDGKFLPQKPQPQKPRGFTSMRDFKRLLDE